MPSSKELGIFLSDYAVWLLGCGATCIRLEKNVRRMAEAFGKRAEFTIMPRHVHMTVYDRDSDDMFTSVATVRKSLIDFDMNTRLSRLSWRVADGDICFAEARCSFDSITSHPRPQDSWALLLLVSLANASFCRLFGGDFVAMVVVFVATLAGYYLKQMLIAAKVDIRVVMIVCAFVSSVLGATDSLFDLGDTQDVSIGTSVLYLVPGVPFLNSFSDLLFRHYICAYSRFVDAAVLTCCLSIGLCGGLMLMKIGMF